MGPLARTFVLIAAGLALSGCNTGRAGVFPHESVAPPPSMSGALSEPPDASARRVPTAAGRTIEAPSQAQASDAEPAVQPVMTGSGVGAGFRF